MIPKPIAICLVPNGIVPELPCQKSEFRAELCGVTGTDGMSAAGPLAADIAVKEDHRRRRLGNRDLPQERIAGGA